MQTLNEQLGLTIEELEDKKRRVRREIEARERMDAFRQAADRYYTERAEQFNKDESLYDPVMCVTHYKGRTTETDIERLRRSQDALRRELAIQRNIINTKIRKNREKPVKRGSKSTDVGW